VVFDADIKGAEKVAEIAQGCNLPIIPVGEKGAGLRMENLALKPTGVNFHVEHEGELYDVDTALIGDFQASNLLVAAGLVMAAGERWADIWKLLGGIRGAKGRMELAGRIGEGDDAVPVLVDYAHTPDALENAINSLKAVTNKDGRLIVVFGCGGDRDQGKRPLMGAIAQKLADIAIVTDDNPRSEDPAAIRAAILAAAPDAMEIGDRQQAIAEAVRMARPGDSILVAGKGHEEGQKVGDEVLPFLDHDAVRKAIELREAAS
jgi:UDP-N-acetylmuramoyl-L-alanyl-D-glutamate--2,6-diaminopimelate ligase